MKKSLLVFLILFMTLVLVSCNTDSVDHPTTDENIGNPTPEQRLSENPNADIVMIDNITYINAKDSERNLSVNDVTKGKKVMEILAQSVDASDFENGTASQLSVGTIIYEAKPNIGYIAVVDNKMRLYVSAGEG